MARCATFIQYSPMNAPEEGVFQKKGVKSMCITQYLIENWFML